MGCNCGGDNQRRARPEPPMTQVEGVGAATPTSAPMPDEGWASAETAAQGVEDARV